MLRVYATMSFLLLAAPALGDGPFGFEKGMTLDQIHALGIETRPNPRVPGTYIVETSPTLDRDFRSFKLAISDKTGLAKIFAIGVTVKTSADGENLREAFERIEKMITSRYGPPRGKLDDLISGSTLRRPDEWMRALRRDDRVLEAIWVPSSARGGGVDAVLLKAVALDAETGYVKLGYEFDNFPEWQRERAGDTARSQ